MPFDPTQPFKVVSAPTPAPDDAATAPSGFDPSKPFQVVHDPSQDTSPVPESQKPGFLDRLVNSATNLKNTFVGGAKAAGEAISHPIDTITDPARRRQLERGIDDMVTLGYGQKLAARVGNALGDAPDTALGPETFSGKAVPNTQESDAIQAPEFRQLGNLVGAAVPGATSSIAKGGAELAGKLIKGAGTVAKVAKGAATAAGTNAALAGLSAGAEGHRLESAADAATDPLAAGLGAAGPLAAEAGKAVGEKFAQPAVVSRIVKDVAHDVTSGEGLSGSATTTAKKLVKQDKADIANVVTNDKDLYKVVGQKAEKAIPVVDDRLNRYGSQLDPHYKLLDEETKANLGNDRAPVQYDDDGNVSQPAGGGGFRSQSLVDAIDKKLKGLKSNTGNSVYSDAFQALKDDIVSKWNRGVVVDDDGNIVRETQDIRNAVTPTQALRKLTTKWQTKAQNVINPLNPGDGTLVKGEIAGFLKDFLDKHLDETADNASTPAAKEAVTNLRELNRKYSALATIRKALDQRAWKEENKSTSLKGHGLHLLQGGAAISGLGALAEGNYGKAALEIGGAYGIPAAIKGANAVRRGVDLQLVKNPTLSKVAQAVPTVAGQIPGAVINRTGAIPLASQGSINARDQVAASNGQADTLLRTLVQRADAGDMSAATKLNSLMRTPIIAARVAALRRQSIK